MIWQQCNKYGFWESTQWVSQQIKDKNSNSKTRKKCVFFVLGVVCTDSVVFFIIKYFLSKLFCCQFIHCWSLYFWEHVQELSFHKLQLYIYHRLWQHGHYSRRKGLLEKAYNRGNGDQENEPHRASKSADGIRNRPNLGRHHGEHTKNLNATGLKLLLGFTYCKCSWEINIVPV